MSAQSIYKKDIESLRQSIREDIINQARSFTLYNRFLVGECVDTKKRNHALMYSSFICTTNCELIEHINNTQMGKKTCIEECCKKAVCKPTTHKTVYIYSKCGGNCDDNENNNNNNSNKDCSDCMIWENKTW